jgi:hypothetical protein
MHYAWTIALRPAGSCLRTSLLNPEKSGLRSAFAVLSNIQPSQRHIHQSLFDRSTNRLSLDRRKYSHDQIRFFSSSTRPCFQTTSILHKLKPYKPGPLDQGLAFRTQDLTQRELAQVFGEQIPPPKFANRLLRILHGRRVDGTLDIDPPEDVTKELQKYPYAAADALKWLRFHYPIDEDAAIMQRLEREESKVERDNPAELMQRAGRLGLYKPQSGTYGANLGEQGDIFGKSELEKIRAANIAEAKREEEALEEQIQQLQKKTKEKVGQLQIRNDNSLEGMKSQLAQFGGRLTLCAASAGQRPPNTYEKWLLQQRNAAQSKLTLDSPEIAGMGLVRMTHQSGAIYLLTGMTLVSPPPAITFLRSCWLRSLLPLLSILGTACPS